MTDPGCDAAVLSAVGDSGWVSTRDVVSRLHPDLSEVVDLNRMPEYKGVYNSLDSLERWGYVTKRRAKVTMRTSRGERFCWTYVWRRTA